MIDQDAYLDLKKLSKTPSLSVRTLRDYLAAGRAFTGCGVGWTGWTHKSDE